MADDILALLPELLRLDRDTGRIFWKARPVSMFSGDNPTSTAKSWNTKFAGKEAFTAIGPDGYFRGTLFNRSYLAHRVVWALVHGEWPSETIDHIDHDGLNNWPENLRAVSQHENTCNQALRSNNSSGVMGVRSVGCRWEAYINIHRRKVHLGTYDTMDEAIDARGRAQRLYNFHANHGQIAA